MLMIKTTLLILSMLWGGLAQADQANFDERELEIYAALINHGLEANVKLVVLDRGTTGDPAAISASEEAATTVVAELGAPAETLDNWQLRNGRSFAIDQPLALNVSYLLLDARTRAEIFADVEPDVGWTAFFTRFPGAPGLLRLSRAGFDDSLTHALVYIEFQCGAGCGSGRLAHLTNVSGAGWQVHGAALVWMVD
jgi:hypothetical protein